MLAIAFQTFWCPLLTVGQLLAHLVFSVFENKINRVTNTQTSTAVINTVSWFHRLLSDALCIPASGICVTSRHLNTSTIDPTTKTRGSNCEKGKLNEHIQQWGGCLHCWWVLGWWTRILEQLGLDLLVVEHIFFMIRLLNRSWNHCLIIIGDTCSCVPGGSGSDGLADYFPVWRIGCRGCTEGNAFGQLLGASALLPFGKQLSSRRPFLHLAPTYHQRNRPTHFTHPSPTNRNGNE